MPARDLIDAKLCIVLATTARRHIGQKADPAGGAVITSTFESIGHTHMPRLFPKTPAIAGLRPPLGPWACDAVEEPEPATVNL